MAGAITSEASGSWGCGAFSSAGEWFQLKLWDRVHITVRDAPNSDRDRPMG